MKLTKFMKVALAASSLTLLPSAANAAVNLELALLIDSSGSIGQTNFNLQKNAYASVLNNISVLPRDGTVAISVYQFASSVTQVFSMQVITSANIGNLISAINGMTYAGGQTFMGTALNTASLEIFSNTITSARQIIDISTDGQPNGGADYNTARTTALTTRGIDQINCIGVGTQAQCPSIIGGTGSFYLNATNFNDFETTLRRKIITEVGAVPEPSTWAMMIGGFGLIGGIMRSRPAANVKVSFV